MFDFDVFFEKIGMPAEAVAEYNNVIKTIIDDIKILDDASGSFFTGDDITPYVTEISRRYSINTDILWLVSAIYIAPRTFDIYHQKCVDESIF